MMPSLMSVAAALCLVLAAHAAVAEEPPPRFPPLQFATATPLLFNLGSVAIEDRSGTEVAAGRIDQTMDAPPAAVVTDWATSRLVAAGRDGSLTMIIREASVIAQPLPVDGGLGAAFKDEEDTKLVGRLVVDFVAARPDGSSAQATVSAFQERTLLESARPIDRRQALYDLSHALIASFDAQATETLEQSFVGFR